MISEKYNFKNKKLNRVKLYFKENINDNKKTIQEVKLKDGDYLLVDL